jgi:predicted AAA+ superfamily ATPase
MRGGGHADVLPVLQMPDNKADVVPCERLRQFFLGFLTHLGPLAHAAPALYHVLLDGQACGAVADLVSLVTSVSSGILLNSGHLLENLVFIALRRIHSEIYYYQTKTGHEVDFIVPACAASVVAGRPTRGRPQTLVQVCESLTDPQTRKREAVALSDAIMELGLKAVTIVTRNEDGRIDIDGGAIELYPR